MSWHPSRVISHDDLRNLTLPDLAVKLLADLADDQANYNSILAGLPHR